MKNLMLLVLVSGLLACSDDKPPREDKTKDAGEESKRDAGVTDEDDAGESTSASGLERAPGSLPRPPVSDRLPDDLKPPR